MERLTTYNPQGNFETILNYVYSKDGIAYIRSDGATDDVPFHEWAKRECIARGCNEFPGTTFEEIDEAICDCALDHKERFGPNCGAKMDDKSNLDTMDGVS